MRSFALIALWAATALAADNQIPARLKDTIKEQLYGQQRPGDYSPVPVLEKRQELRTPNYTDPDPVPVASATPGADGDGKEVCKAYGVDFQDGGEYFVDKRSRELFTAGTRFEGLVSLLLHA